MARPAHRRWRAAIAVALAAVVGCANDPGVTTLEAAPIETMGTTGATTTVSVDEAGDEASADDDEPDLATAGDTLYPDVGNDGIDVAHYVVRIAYDPAEQVVAGQVTITLTAAVDLDVIVLDAVDLEIEAVTVDGATVPFETSSDELVVEQSVVAGSTVDVDVTYVDHVGADALGADIGWFTTPTGSYVLNEPDGLRTWMPAHDHPSDKATWRFELAVPDGLAGIANGEQQPSVDAGDDTTWIWEQRDPMSTYLVQLLTGEYEVVDGATAGTTPLVHVALAGDVERMQPYFDTVDEQLAYFESVFGPYPLDGYGLAFTESYPGLAMETQGRSMFSRSDFPAVGATGEIGLLQDLLLAHELAHQWFGDAVSPADWSDLWLNESFATYGQWLWFDHTDRLPIEFIAAEALAQRQDPTEPTGAPTVDNLFGLERYDGGAVVLHALRFELGDEAFFTLLSRWVADNDGTSRRSADFIALSEEVAGRSLTEFFDIWLYADAVPAAYPT